MGERNRDRLVAHPQLRPRGVAALGVVADIEGDGAGTPREVERLLGVHGQGGDRPPIVDGVNQLAVADLDVIGRVDQGRAPTAGQLAAAQSLADDPKF